MPGISPLPTPAPQVLPWASRRGRVDPSLLTARCRGARRVTSIPGRPEQAGSSRPAMPPSQGQRQADMSTATPGGPRGAAEDPALIDSSQEAPTAYKKVSVSDSKRLDSWTAVRENPHFENAPPSCGQQDAPAAWKASTHYLKTSKTGRGLGEPASRSLPRFLLLIPEAQGPAVTPAAPDLPVSSRQGRPPTAKTPTAKVSPRPSSRSPTPTLHDPYAPAISPAFPQHTWSPRPCFPPRTPVAHAPAPPSPTHPCSPHPRAPCLPPRTPRTPRPWAPKLGQQPSPACNLVAQGLLLKAPPQA